MADVDTSWREALTTRLGPFPAYVWGLGLGAAAAGVLAWRRRQAAVELPIEGEGSDTTGTDAGGSELVTGTASGYGDFTLSPSPMGGGSWATAPTPTPPPASEDDDEPTTNAQWRQRAANWLASDAGGRYSPTLVNDALVKFLDGNAVNAQEESVIIRALREFGQPPQGAPPLIRIPVPPVTPPPTSTLKVPGPPRNVRTGKVDGAGIRVGWDVPSTTGGAAISGYLVQWENQNNPGAWVSRTVTTTNLTVPATGGGKYRVRVAARNSRGLSTWAATTWLDSYRPPTTPPAKPPAKPPATPPATKPPADKIHTIKSGDILWNLVRSYYGKVTLPAVRQIATYNGLRLVGSGTNVQPSPWQIGQTVKFPPASKVTF